MTAAYSSPLTAAPVSEIYGDDFFTKEVTDLVGAGFRGCSAQDTSTVRLWRYRNRDQPRLTRRFEAKPTAENNCCDDNSSCCSYFCVLYYLFSSCISCKWRKMSESEFPMLTGPGRFFHIFIHQHPFVALCIWLFLFLCEGTIVSLYIVQTNYSSGVSWLVYADEEYGWFFYAHTVFSIVLLSQLVFAYSVSPFTIIIVLVTSCYQIIIFIIAVIFKFGWFSRLYVPLFLRCWPMRQYFLFLLDSLALLTPRNYQFDVIRHAAPQLSLFLTITFTSGCIFHIHQVFRGFELGLGESVYWVIMTMCTVGFGDIVAQGADGRALAMILICIFLSMMPTWVLSVTSTARILADFPKYTGGEGHFFVYGHTRYEDAVSILDEVFTLYPTKTVCFCFTSFESDVLAIGRDPRYRLRSKFFVVKNLDRRTLTRLRVRDATAIIIFSNRDGSLTSRDADVMLWSVLFQRNAPHVPQYLRLCLGVYVKLLRERQNTLVDQDLRVIMAKALLLPGVVPFLVNLIRTSSACGSSSPTLWDEGEMDNWKEQYEYSRRNVFVSFPVPWFFQHLRFWYIVQLMKLHDVLVVGVEEGSRKLMRLDLEYCVETGDTLLVICERGSNSLSKALEALEPRSISVSGSDDDSESHANAAFRRRIESSLFSFRDSVDSPESGVLGFETTLQDTYSSEKRFCYPYYESFGLGFVTRKKSRAFDERVATNNGIAADGSENHTQLEISQEVTDQMNYEQWEMDVRSRLLGLSFVNVSPHGVSLNDLPLGGSLHLLEALLKCRQAYIAARSETGKIHVKRIEQQINDILDHMAEEHLSGDDTEDHVENFLFVDQVLSFFKPSPVSFYDEHLIEKISRYELLQMMHGIHSIYANSRLTLLSHRKLDVAFLRWWYASFRFPLRHVRGMGLLDCHLDCALQQVGGVSNLRGVLLYCSQRGVREFADVPIITVKNKIQTLIEWASLRQEESLRKEGTKTKRNRSQMLEQHVLVELQSFASCVYVTPYHTDAEWRRLGEVHFQHSLAFMMGRCFSVNMFDTIFIHTHNDRHILQFFEMVLCLKEHDESFDIGLWASTRRKSPTLFQLCGNQLLHFQTFGDAFFFLLLWRSWITIGVFRRFPASEGLQGTPRYFITNPPLKMALRADDVIYALSTSTDVGETLYS